MLQHPCLCLTVKCNCAGPDPASLTRDQSGSNTRAKESSLLLDFWQKEARWLPSCASEARGYKDPWLLPQGKEARLYEGGLSSQRVSLLLHLAHAASQRAKEMGAAPQLETLLRGRRKGSEPSGEW